MQGIAGPQMLAGIEVEPALAAFRLGARIPGDAEGLQPSAGHLDEILLQWRQSERELDREIGRLAVGTLGADKEILPLGQEGRGHAILVERGAIEGSQHRGRAGMLHRLRVLRSLPGRVFALMAGRAGRAADEGRGRLGRGGCRQVGGRGLGVQVQRGGRAQEDKAWKNERAPARLAQNLTLSPMIGPCSTRLTPLLLPVLV